MKTTVFFFLHFSSLVSSFSFQDPRQDEVTYVDTNSHVEVTVDENNSGGKVTIVRITDAQNKPQIITYPNPNPLGAEVEEDSNQFIIKVNLLDYEALLNKIEPRFTLKVTDSKDEKNLTVTVKNLDDENPSLEVTTCYMEEELIIDVSNSKCVFNVSDPDGNLASMTFTIIGTEEVEENIFEFKYKTVPRSDLQESEVYLVLKRGQILDYEIVTGFNFAVEAKDAAGNPTVPNARVPITLLVQNKPPVWNSVPSILYIDEETPMSFQVTAVDGDKNSDHSVVYSLLNPSAFVTIDGKTGNITVQAVDREKGTTFIFIRVEASYADFNASTKALITLLINDIDDNVAKIEGSSTSATSSNITVPKKSDKVDIQVLVVDLDAGENSVYDLELVLPNDVKSAFYVSPKRGAGSTVVDIIINSTELQNYDPLSNYFQIELRTRGVKNSSHVDTWPLTVFLEKDEVSSGVDLAGKVITTILVCLAVSNNI